MFTIYYLQQEDAMGSEYVLREYFSRYLREIRGSSEATVKHYHDALRYISRYLVKAGKIENSIYEIKDIGQLEIIREFLYNDAGFIALNTRGHQMYSAGLNNYLKFAMGEEFETAGETIRLLDVEVYASEPVVRGSVSWSRSSIIKNQVLRTANYQCEIDSGHQTFVAKSSGQQYMEGHHMIPMKKQPVFAASLDVYANIVCLCPVCHRLLHYGLASNKKELLDRMYETRIDRLVNSGIKLSKDDFLKMAI